MNIRPDGKSVKAYFPRTHFLEKDQVKLAIGISPKELDPKSSKIQRLRLTLQDEMKTEKLDNENGFFNKMRFQLMLKNLGFKSGLKRGKATVASNDQVRYVPFW